MPVLSLEALLALRLSGMKGPKVVHYDILSRNLRGLSRFLKVPQDKITSALSTLLRLDIRKIKHGDDVPDYPHVHLKAMETVTTIAGKLIPEVRKNDWTARLGKLLGEKPSLAYSTKYLSQFHLFSHILPMAAFYKSENPPKNCPVIWDPEWPQDWNRTISSNLDGMTFDFFRWPALYLAPRSAITKGIVLLKLPVTTLAHVMRRGVSLRTPKKDRFKLITEFIDPWRLDGKAYDADYWVDGGNIAKHDALFFLTSLQKRILEGDGHSVGKIKQLFRDKGYRLTVLDHLPYSPGSLKDLASAYAQVWLNAVRLDGSILGAGYYKAWCEYMEFLPLFLHNTSKILTYLTFPNGHTGVRFNDAVVTGLCRKHGIRSVGCQTRVIYAKKFEDCFDCFDVYLSWGKSWEHIAEERMAFIKKTATIGCVYLDSLLPQYRNFVSANADREAPNGVRVAIFPSDISHNHHYTKSYTKSLLMNFTEIAAAFPDCNFIVKTKDPEHVNIMMAERDFRESYSDVKDNFAFADRLRFDYATLLFSSDIVVAIGFTTPGTEGMLLGKSAIYYSKLRCGGQAFSHMPFLIAGNGEQLMELFSKALQRHRGRIEMDADGIDKLDPFRDGAARDRIHRILLADNKPPTSP